MADCGDQKSFDGLQTAQDGSDFGRLQTVRVLAFPSSGAVRSAFFAKGALSPHPSCQHAQRKDLLA